MGIIGLQAREHHEALQAARQRQTTEEFRQKYAARAGIQGTDEQAICRCGFRCSDSSGVKNNELGLWPPFHCDLPSRNSSSMG
jgi:transposase